MEPRKFKEVAKRGFNIQFRTDMHITNTADVMALAKTPQQQAKILPLVDFCSDHEVPRVPDPYHGGQRGFEHVAELLEDGCAGIPRPFTA